MSTMICPWCGRAVEQQERHISPLDQLQHHMWVMHRVEWRRMVLEAVRREVMKEKAHGNGNGNHTDTG